MTDDDHELRALLERTLPPDVGADAERALHRVRPSYERAAHRRRQRQAVAAFSAAALVIGVGAVSGLNPFADRADRVDSLVIANGQPDDDPDASSSPESDNETLVPLPTVPPHPGITASTLPPNAPTAPAPTTTVTAPPTSVGPSIDESAAVVPTTEPAAVDGAGATAPTTTVPPPPSPSTTESALPTEPENLSSATTAGVVTVRWTGTRLVVEAVQPNPGYSFQTRMVGDRDVEVVLAAANGSQVVLKAHMYVTGISFERPRIVPPPTTSTTPQSSTTTPG